MRCEASAACGLLPLLPLQLLRIAGEHAGGAGMENLTSFGWGRQTRAGDHKSIQGEKERERERGRERPPAVEGATRGRVVGWGWVGEVGGGGGCRRGGGGGGGGGVEDVDLGMGGLRGTGFCIRESAGQGPMWCNMIAAAAAAAAAARLLNLEGQIF